MTVQDTFWRAYKSLGFDGATEPALLPDRLAAAVVAVLPVQGASLSFAEGSFRVPLGASDNHSARAERFQFTVGTGPCLDAIRMGCYLSANTGELQERWPMLAQAWWQHTPFRSAVSTPVFLTGPPRAAMDLYFTASGGGEHLNLVDVDAVADLVADELSEPASAGLVGKGTGASWLDGSAATGRQRVWLAIGMTMEHFDINAADALARLRAQAWTQDTSIDHFADRLINNPNVISDLAS